MRPSIGLIGLCLLLAPTVLAQDNDPPERLPDLATVSAPDGEAAQTTAEDPRETARPTDTNDNEDNEENEDNEDNEDERPRPTDEPQPTRTAEDFKLTGSAPPASSVPTDATTTRNGPATSLDVFHLTGLPTIAGVGIPDMGVPDTAAAPYMQKSNLPDGTVFICVGAALGFFGAAILAWRGLVAWSLHRSVKRAALAQNMSDMKGAGGLGGRKKGLYNVVGANSNLSLDHLSAAPPGKSKPFASTLLGGTPPKSTSTNSLFFSPTAGARPDSMVNRSSSYLPAGYYSAGNAQAASGAPLTQVGGNGHLSTHSLATPGNRYSTRSGISPPASPSLPPSRGYDRAPPSRDGHSMYNRNSVATLGTQPGGRGMYGAEQGSMSQLSLNVPGGTTVAGGRAPSAYLEDLFENGAVPGSAGGPGANANNGQQRY